MNEYQIKGWFFTTIKNKNIDVIRKNKRLTFLNENEVPEEIDSFEEEVLIKDLIECLPEANKKVILLRYQMNLNSTEIGKVLGLSPSTVRSRLSASMKILRNNIDGEE